MAQVVIIIRKNIMKCFLKVIVTREFLLRGLVEEKQVKGVERRTRNEEQLCFRRPFARTSFLRGTMEEPSTATDFRTAFGVPEQDRVTSTAVSEGDSAKVTGLLRPLTKDRGPVFAPKIDKSRETQIYRRQRNKQGSLRKREIDEEGLGEIKKARRDVEAEIFDDISEEEEVEDSERDEGREIEEEKMEVKQEVFKVLNVIKHEREPVEAAARPTALKVSIPTTGIQTELNEAKKKLLQLKRLRQQKLLKQQQQASLRKDLPVVDIPSNDSAIASVAGNVLDKQHKSSLKSYVKERQGFLEKKRAEPLKETTDGAMEEESSSEESEEDSSSEEDEAPTFQLRFVSKTQRKKAGAEVSDQLPDSLATLQEPSEETTLKLQEVEAQRKEIEVEETRRQLKDDILQENRKKIEALKRDDAGLINARDDMPDDTDGVDESAEYETWKLRELARLKRDLEKKHQHELEKQEILRRRYMTPEEIERENQELIEKGERRKDKEKQPLQFLQKYYHKGAFYMDDETIGKFEQREGRVDPRRNEYSGATGDDRQNMEILPEVLQRKNFGKRSQTKWTHLSNEDTTKGNNLWKDANRFQNKGREG